MTLAPPLCVPLSPVSVELRQAFFFPWYFPIFVSLPHSPTTGSSNSLPYVHLPSYITLYWLALLIPAVTLRACLMMIINIFQFAQQNTLECKIFQKRYIIKKQYYKIMAIDKISKFRNWIVKRDYSNASLSNNAFSLLLKVYRLPVLLNSPENVFQSVEIFAQIYIPMYLVLVSTLPPYYPVDLGSLTNFFICTMYL